MADSNHTVQIEVDAACGLDQTNMDSYLRFNIPASTFANKKVWKHEILVGAPFGEEFPFMRAVNVGQVPAALVITSNPDNADMIFVGWRDHTLGGFINISYISPGEQAIITNIGRLDDFGLSEDTIFVVGSDGKELLCKAEILVFEV